MLKYKYQTDTGMTVEVNNPDEKMRAALISHIQEKEAREREAFLEEVRVAIRKLKPGEKMHLESRPITVDIEHVPDVPAVSEEASRG